MKPIRKKAYEDAIKPLRNELIDLQRWMIAAGKRVVVVFEGRDAAGKGGVIKAIEEPLNNRYVRTVALSKPDETERGQWYFQRYAAHLPTAGELVLFDRSWYNRAGVEHIMGFCTDIEYRQFLVDCPQFERLVTATGTILVKYWLAVDQQFQEERFAERGSDPRKRWKLSPIDIKARDQYVAYGKARDVMLEGTHAEHAPWFVVDFNDQRRGRLNLIRHLLDHLPEREPPAPGLQLDPLRGKPAKERIPRRFRISEPF